jgi:hypothetical protein
MRPRWLWVGSSAAAAALGASLLASHGCALIAGVQTPDPKLEHCLDGKQDGDETGVDCGGSCGACDDAGCGMPSDCASGMCAGGVCAPSTCKDGILNGLESATDCGDPRPDRMCPPCPNGEYCYTGCNCASKHCDLTMHVCSDSVEDNCDPCADFVKDGAETDVDCGGGTCPACADGLACAVDADCASAHCRVGNTGGECLPATCFDETKDGSETGVDCGGPCGACLGSPCATGTDCASGVCAAGDAGAGTCATTCTDGVKDGDETDVDCGGSCPPCGDGMVCEHDADCVAADRCVNRVCRTASCAGPGSCGQPGCGACGGTTCSAAVTCWSGCCNERGECCPSTCVNGQQDPGETGVDCGGGTCAGCAVGVGCERTRDCAAGAFCDPKTLACSTKGAPASCTDASQDGTETGHNCGGLCPPCGVGEGCLTGADCASAHCGPTANGQGCLGLPTSCGDGVQDNDETDVDCGGSCPPCFAGRSCKQGGDCDSGVCTLADAGAGGGGGGGADAGSGAGTCAAPTCSDGVQNGAEPDVDCGATCPTGCASGKHCFVDQDCTSGTCSASSGTCM